MNNYLVIDIENNSTKQSEAFGRKAGTPFLGDALVAIGLKNQQELKSQYIYPNKLTEFHIDEEVLVLHNAAHDLQWFWFLDSFQDWLKAGGQVYDTALAQYIISGQGEKYPALRELAVRLGRPKREKLMEAYWDPSTTKIVDWSTKQILYTFPKITDNLTVCKYLDENEFGSVDIIHGKIDTSGIPKELVLQDVEQDVLDTEFVYLKQQEQLTTRPKMKKLITLQMDALLATIECSMNGLYVNKEVLQQNKQELVSKLEQRENELASLVKEYWK